MDKLEKRHHNLVELIAGRLEGHYDGVLTEYKYHLKGKYGECDILTNRNGYFNYYEIKGRHCSKNKTKATKQLRRWQACNPEIKTRLIYCARRKDNSLYVRRIR